MGGPVASAPRSLLLLVFSLVEPFGPGSHIEIVLVLVKIMICPHFRDTVGTSVICWMNAMV